MKQLRHSRMSLMLAAITVSVLIGGGIVRADFVFGEPVNMGPTLNTSTRDEEPGISSDDLSIYFCSQRSGGRGGYDMWVTTRATKQDDWGPPVNLGPTVNSSSDDFSEDISADGLELYFGSNRPGGRGGYDIWVAKRATTQDDWTTPVNPGPMVNSSSQEGCPAVSDDGLELYFWSTRPGGFGSWDIWVSRRATKQDDWGPAENVGSPVNSSYTELCMDISPDDLMLIFVSARPGGYGGQLGDLWMTRRAATDEPWGPPINLGPKVNTSGDENGPCVSSDGTMLYYSSNRPGGSGSADMWQVPIEPKVDFNDDGIVDIDDLVLMIENWNTSESLYDIGPFPWGDGVVDKEDLEVLMSYWEQEVDDPTLIAHWKLDETEGTEAADSAGTVQANLYGDPQWQPEGGMVDGALLLDGIDDFVGTWNISGIDDGDLSVFAWIKGGAPGQVIISQFRGVNWLMADVSEGFLATDLTTDGSEGGTLVSNVTITDGEWHRVGIIWDGTDRTLYVDGVEAASDTQSSLNRTEMGLNFGCDPDSTAGTFFSGLIDDVRIYNRAVTP